MRASIVSTLRSLVALLALVAGSSRPLRAQPPLGAVTLRVSPDSGLLVTGAFRSDTAVFRIHNDDAMEDIATLTCSISGTITQCSPPSQVVLAPGDSADVRIPFATGASGTGTLALEAQGMAFGNRADGSFAVTVADTFAVSVTPLDSNPVGMEPSAYASVRFLVVNRSTTTVTYALSCTPSGPIGCVNLTASWLMLGRDGRDTVVATLVSQSTTGVASAMLVAASDSAVGQGTYDVTVTREAVFSLAPFGGDRLVRGMCPVIGAGPESAAQCGDLLYAHALPAYRSMNRARAVTLMYGSALARPTPIVAVDYTTYPYDPRPDSVVVEVRRDGGLLAATWFSAAGFDLAQKQVHRLVVPIDAVAAGLGTGAHPVHVTFRRFVNGAWLGSADTASTTLLVVDRRSSPFGAGWTLAGVERLHPNQLGNAVLLAFADGSALLFRPSANPADTSYVSPAGEHSQLVRLSAGGFVRTLAGGRVAIQYDSAGLVRTIRDNNPTPNVATYHWSPDPLDGARLDSIVDPALRAVRFDYDSAGRATGIRVPGVAPVVLYQSTAPTGVARLDSLADPDGFRLRYAYDGGSDLMTSSRSRGTGLVRYFYHATTATLDSVSAPGGAGLGRQLRAWQRYGAPESGTGSRALPATPALADSARVMARWQRGTAWESVSFRLDRHYAPTEVTSPLGEVTRIDRDSIGQPVYVRTPSNGRIWQRWDANGNLVATIVRQFGGWQDPNAVRFDTTRYTYDSTWQELDTIVDPLGRRTEFGYDSHGRRTSVTDPTGRTTTFEYSPRGQLVRITAPNADLTGPEAHPTEYTYDPANFNLRRTDRGVERVEYSYDSLNTSDLVASRDASGQEVRYTYDAIKRPLAIDRSMGSVIRYEYDDTLRLVRQYDPVNPNPSVVERDAAGRVVRECVRPNECDVVTYGDGVNPTHVLTRTGGAHMQQFDAAGRLLRRQMSEGYAAEFDTVRFTYDAGGNATAVSNRYSNVYRTFDEYGRMRRERQEIRKWSEAWKDSLPDDAYMGVEAWHDYDRLGRRSRTWLGNTVAWTTVCQHTPLLPDQDPDDDPCRSKDALRATDSIAFAYDGAGRLASVTNTLWQRRKGTGNRVWGYAYDGRDRLTTFTVPTLTSSVEVHRGYDALDRLTSYAMPSHSVTLTRDDAGRVIDDGDFYTYDLLGRLTVVTSGNASRANQFTYDLLGNRLTDKAFTYGYDGHGRLVSKSGNGCQGQFTYDMRGNRLRSIGCDGEDELVMEYDAANRMTKLTNLPTVTNQPVSSRRFWYDGLGRRILMRSDSLASDDWGIWRYWWLDDNVAVKTWNFGNDSTLYDWKRPRLERAADDSLRGTGEWFYYALGVDALLGSWNYQDHPEIHHLFFHDYRGSVIRVTNAAGQALGLTPAYYEAFGRSAPGAPPGASKNPGYNGHESAGGLVYMRNRWYDPNNGQFTQEDPIGYAGGINLYGYVGNDPISYSDPYGLCYGNGLIAALCTAVEGAVAASSGSALPASQLPSSPAADFISDVADGAANLVHKGFVWTQTVIAAARIAGDAVLSADKARPTDGSDQRDGIEKARDFLRRQGQPDRINRDNKSQQRGRVSDAEKAQRALEGLDEDDDDDIPE